MKVNKKIKDDGGNRVCIVTVEEQVNKLSVMKTYDALEKAEEIANKELGKLTIEAEKDVVVWDIQHEIVTVECFSGGFRVIAKATIMTPNFNPRRV